MSIVKLNTVSTVDAICASLEEDIFSLRYGPGTKIREKDLTIRYGVSRNTIREAITYFLTNGLLVKIANKGVYVRKITIDDIQEIFHLRNLLESEAIRLIMQTGQTPPELIRAAEAVCEIDPAVDWQNSIKKDMAFHKLLVQCSGSTRLVRLYESIQAEVKLCVYQSYEFITHSYVPVRTENAMQHMNILTAMSHGDLDLALQYLSIHIESAINNYTIGYMKKEYMSEKNPQNKGRSRNK